MTLKQFYATHCKDIAERVARMHKKLYPHPFDVTDVDEEGHTIFCIRASNDALIDVDELIFAGDDAFKEKYPFPEAQEAREKYLAKLKIFDGEDALHFLMIELEEVRKQREENIKEAQRLINDQSKVDKMFAS